jgi:hypothetical protein
MPDAKKFAITWIELVLLILTVAAGMGIWIVAKQWVDISEKTNEPLELNYQKEANVLNDQAKLSSAQSEVAALQARLTQERVEQVKKQYLVDSLTEVQKTQKPPTPSANAELEKARADFEATKGLITRLSTDLDNKLAASTAAQLELETAKRRAATDLAKAQLKFLWHKRLITLEYFGIGVAVLLLLVLMVVSVLSLAGRFKASRKIVVGGAAGLLAILIGYEILELAGAALIGVLIVIVVLALMPSGERDPAT